MAKLFSPKSLNLVFICELPVLLLMLLGGNKLHDPLNCNSGW